MMRNEGWQAVENPGARKMRVLPSENGNKKGEPVISPHEFQEAYARVGLAMERFEDQHEEWMQILDAFKTLRCQQQLDSEEMRS